jgi:predicted lipoprotein with Yx(FWY)xxD motif
LLAVGALAGVAFGTALGSAGASAAKHAAPQTVVITENSDWGSILALSTGTTVYRLTTDSKNKSVCSGKCAVYWPPVLLRAGQSTPVGRGVIGLGTIKRPGGAKQVTYRGLPLYTFVGDKKPGAVTGNVKDSWGRWWVINPSNPTGTPHKTTANGGSSSTSSANDATPTTSPSASTPSSSVPATTVAGSGVAF